jgi:hypothetical protein
MELIITKENNNYDIDIIFTRYLYIKQEVKLSLLVALLNKNSEQALFWVDELYYSGFISELLEYIFKIYYDFYASLNGKFETYLLKKAKEFLTSNTKDNKIKIIHTIILNLISRPFNIDVFMLVTICEVFDIECIYENSNVNDILIQWVNDENYLSIAQFILKENKELSEIKIYELMLDAFCLLNDQINKNKLVKEFSRSKIANIDTKNVLLAKIMELFGICNNVKMGKNKYIILEPDDSNCEILNIKNWKILSHVCKYNIDEYKHLGLFNLYRNKLTNDDLFQIYNSKWEYYAFSCPYWNDKITSCLGLIDHIHKKVIFDEETDFKDGETAFVIFHDNYDFEPDEQHMEIKNKCVGKIDQNMDLEKFYKKYKNNGLLELDAEFLNDIIGSRIFYTK